MQIERIEERLRGVNRFDVLGMWIECGMERKKKEKASLAESGAANKSALCVVLGVNKAKIAESHFDPLLNPIREKPHFHSYSDQMYDTIIAINQMESSIVRPADWYDP